MKREKITKGFIIGTFVTLYVVVSLISTIHVIDFFRLSNPEWLAVSLAVAFEIGAAASLAALIALDKMNKWMIWAVFIILTAMQMMGNTYYTYTHLENYQSWSELFGLIEEEPIFQKRVLSIISGAILPIIALGFIKSLVDYIRPPKVEEKEELQTPQTPQQIDVKRVWDKVAELKKEGKLPTPTEEDLADEPTALANSGYRERAEEEAIREDLLNEEVEEDATERSDVKPMSSDLVRYLESTGELTREDIENYKEKTKRNGGREDGLNPQVLPGVN
jgi:hypothetical protein